MESFIEIIASSVDVVALALLLIFLLVLVIFTSRARGGRRFPLRPIPVYEKIRRFASLATESGQPLHIGMGSGQIGTRATPESLMAITVFDYIAQHAALGNHPIQGTTGNATVLATAQGVLQQARREAGFPERYVGKEIGFYGPDPLAYAAGTFDSLCHEEHLANVLVGQFGAEGLWIAESAHHRDLAQVGGTTEPAAAALMHVGLDESVIGEDVFAAGAYLHKPDHLGSLAAQDFMRIIIILSITVGVVMTSLGYWS